MKRIRSFIIIIIIFIIILSIILYRLILQKNEEKVDYIEAEPEIVIVEDEGRQDNLIPLSTSLTKENNEYYFILINNKVNELYESLQDRKIDKAMNMLSKSFINENNITQENLYNIFKNTNEYIYFYTQNAEWLSSGDNVDYYIDGLIETEDQLVETYILLHIDYRNNTFSIENFDISKFSTDEKIEVNTERIEYNGDNKYIFDIENIDELMCTYYIKDFTTKIRLNIEYAYNVINNDYKNVKFSNIKLLENYYNNNKERFDMCTVRKYSYNNSDNIKEYKLIDNMDNNYIIEVDANNVLNYNIKLDNYSVKDEEYVKNYNNLSDGEKALKNVRNVINMINNKEYSTVYNYLNNNFKSKYFSSEASFVEYLNNNFFQLNLINSIENEQEKEEYYIFDINLVSGKGVSSKSINKRFVVLLKEGTEFEISFTV